MRDDTIEINSMWSYTIINDKYNISQGTVLDAKANLFESSYVYCAGWNDPGDDLFKYYLAISNRFAIKKNANVIIIKSPASDIIEARELSEWKIKTAKVLEALGVEFSLIEKIKYIKDTASYFDFLGILGTKIGNEAINEIYSIGTDFKKRFEQSNLCPYFIADPPYHIIGHSLGTTKAKSMINLLPSEDTIISLFAPTMVDFPQTKNQVNVFSSQQDVAIEVLQKLMGMNAISTAEEWSPYNVNFKDVVFPNSDSKNYNAIDYLIKQGDSELLNSLSAAYLKADRFHGSHYDVIMDIVYKTAPKLDAHTQLKVMSLIEMISVSTYDTWRTQ